MLTITRMVAMMENPLIKLCASQDRSLRRIKHILAGRQEPPLPQQFNLYDTDALRLAGVKK